MLLVWRPRRIHSLLSDAGAREFLAKNHLPCRGGALMGELMRRHEALRRFKELEREELRIKRLYSEGTPLRGLLRMGTA